MLTHNHLFVSASTPIAAHIPIKVKEKIWANQFIEFHELLSPYPWAPSTAETEQHTSQEPAADKAGRQQNTKREPHTLAQWTTAWNCFTVVLSVKSPKLAPALAHHMEVVLCIAEKRGDWVYYDVAFRATWPRTKPAGVRPT